MQSWADIASDSDDDSVGLHHPANAQVQPAEPEPKEVVEEEVVEEEAPPPKEYDWPTDPPFTAYVGNLPYSIKDSSELSRGIEDLVNNRFQTRVTIVQSRLAMDRQENRPRGFGYVEVETVDELKTLLRLNDGKSLFKGRPLKFDVASPPSNHNNSRRSLNRSSSRGESSRSNISDVDGSSFRGGRYMNRRDNSSSSSLRRQSSASSDTSDRQRPSLKLAPRSKPADQKESGSSSNLFGSGRARDDAEWERRRSETKQDRRGSASSAGGGGGGSRGGGGGGGGGRGNNNNKGKGGGNKGRGGGGGGRGGKGGKDSQKKNQQQKEKAADAAPKAVLKPPPKVAEPPAKPETTKVQNKFSALNMDSDSD